MLSISSPNIEMRQARSSRWAGKISIVSPRTRKTSRGEIHVAPLVLLRHEIGQQRPLVEPVADLHLEGHGRVGFDRADTVDARHRGDNDDIIALQQRAGGRVAHAVDLLVDRGFLLDERIGARHIGFGW